MGCFPVLAATPRLGDALASARTEVRKFSFHAQVRVLGNTSVLVGRLDFSAAWTLENFMQKAPRRRGAGGGGGVSPSGPVRAPHPGPSRAARPRRPPCGPQRTAGRFPRPDSRGSQCRRAQWFKMRSSSLIFFLFLLV